MKKLLTFYYILVIIIVKDEKNLKFLEVNYEKNLSTCNMRGVIGSFGNFNSSAAKFVYGASWMDCKIGVSFGSMSLLK